MSNNDPFVEYERRALGAKHTLAMSLGAMLGGIFGLGLVGIMVYLILNVDKEIIKLAGTILVFGVVATLLFAPVVFVIVKYVRQPGQQLPDTLARLERFLES
jgi:hypothetical protein